MVTRHAVQVNAEHRDNLEFPVIYTESDRYNGITLCVELPCGRTLAIDGAGVGVHVTKRSKQAHIERTPLVLLDVVEGTLRFERTTP